jgi:cytochrome c2
LFAHQVREPAFGLTEPALLRSARRLLVAVIALLLCGCTRESDVASVYAQNIGDPARGRHLIFAYGCGSCHVVLGVSGASGTVGPPLNGFGERAYVAGFLPNRPSDLARWIVNPQELKPGTAMPRLGVSPEQARHIAAYLYTLR